MALSKEDEKKSEEYTLAVAQMAQYIITQEQYEILIRLLANYDLLMKAVCDKTDQDLPFWCYDEGGSEDEVSIIPPTDK